MSDRQIGKQHQWRVGNISRKGAKEFHAKGQRKTMTVLLDGAWRNAPWRLRLHAAPATFNMAEAQLCITMLPEPAFQFQKNGYRVKQVSYRVGWPMQQSIYHFSGMGFPFLRNVTLIEA